MALFRCCRTFVGWSPTGAGRRFVAEEDVLHSDRPGDADVLKTWPDFFEEVQVVRSEAGLHLEAAPKHETR